MTRIERADLEAKLNEIKGVIDDTTTAAKDTTVMIAVGVAVFVVAAFVIGKWRGKRHGSAVVKVYKL